MGKSDGERYVVFERLGIGGMAEVSLARDTRLGRNVVIKRLKPSLASRDDLVSMFVDEARTVAQISHPNIIQIYDFGYQDGLPFMALEWLEGWDLATIFAESRIQGVLLPLDFVISLTVDTCRGLYAAHTACMPDGSPLHLVHRDISPQNLFVTAKGVLKILDFGVAKTTIQQRKTQIGTIKGKYCYMSPEQFSGKSVDARSDLFSLGIVLHEMLTGKPLFEDYEFDEMFRAITDGTAPPAVREGEPLPENLVAITARALSRGSDLRFQSADELGRALSRVLDDCGATPTDRERADYVERLLSTSKPPNPITRRISTVAIGRLDKRVEAPQLPPVRQQTERIPTNEALAPIPRASSLASDRWPESGNKTVYVRARHRSARRARARIRPEWLVAAAVVVVVAAATGVLWLVGGRSKKNAPPAAIAMPKRADQLAGPEPTEPIVDDGPAHNARDVSAALPAGDPRDKHATNGKAAKAPPATSNADRLPPEEAPAWQQGHTRDTNGTRQEQPEVTSEVLGVDSDASRNNGTQPMDENSEHSAAHAAHAAPNSRRSKRPKERERPPLAKKRPLTRGNGTLTVETIPWANVYLGKQRLGPTPLINLKVPAGDLQLRFVNRQFGIDTTRTISVPVNGKIRQKIQLLP